MEMKGLKKYFYFILPVLGVLFYLLYLHTAAIDMVYSDYIRLINSYLPDIWDPKKFFVPDLLTRIPVNYLERAINVTFFGYSVTFDRVLSVLCFGASACIIAGYSYQKKISFVWYAVIMAVMFSLNKWEMLYNGTGWAHFLAFACFYYNYRLLDKVYGNEYGARAGAMTGTGSGADAERRTGAGIGADAERRTGAGSETDTKRKTGAEVRSRVLLFVLPPLITLGVAGPYCAIYTVTLVLAYLFLFLNADKHSPASSARSTKRRVRGGCLCQWELKAPTDRSRSDCVHEQVAKRIANVRFTKRVWNRCGLILALFDAVIPFLIYLWSNSQAVYEYSGAAGGSLTQNLLKEPVFFIKFLLKSFASMVFGVELIDRHLTGIPGKVWCLLGLLVILAYFMALWLNFSSGLAERTILPLMLLAGGGMNHLMVLVSRWIFMPNDCYGMSSRYALQYQIGIIGILLTFALVWKEETYKKTRRERVRETRREDCGKTRKKTRRRAVMVLTASVFLAGNLLTTAEEFSFGRHRKSHNLDVKQILMNFEQESEETLKAALEYRKPGTREALTILKENGWNIFREKQ